MSPAEELRSIFVAIRQSFSEDLGEVAALTPHNPFYASGYVAARAALGAEAWLIGMRSNGHSVRDTSDCDSSVHRESLHRNNGRWSVGCPAFLTSGRLNRSLEIPSWPSGEGVDVFWEGLLSFCREQRVSRLDLNSFASVPAAIQPWQGTRAQGAQRSMVLRRRCEYVLDLRADLLGRCSANHARNIKRARKTGLTVHRTTEREACRHHADLMCNSLARRQERGETIHADVGAEERLRPIVALVSHGAGELFQAVDETRVLSSILVLRAELGAYYHSAGTSPEGMSCGASHFLVHQIAEMLREEGVEQFNLGGADAASGGLERFKSGFGATARELAAAEMVLAGPFRQALGRLRGSLHKLNSRIRELGLLSGRWEGVR